MMFHGNDTGLPVFNVFPSPSPSLMWVEGFWEVLEGVPSPQSGV